MRYIIAGDFNANVRFWDMKDIGHQSIFYSNDYRDTPREHLLIE